MISPRTHAVIDYVVGLLLLFAPYLFGFADGGPAQLVPMILGIIIIVYSTLTNYHRSGTTKLIPYRSHLMIDVLIGLLLLVSPWVFGFADEVWWPHVVVGVASIGVVVMSWRRAQTVENMP